MPGFPEPVALPRLRKELPRHPEAGRSRRVHATGRSGDREVRAGNTEGMKAPKKEIPPMPRKREFAALAPTRPKALLGCAQKRAVWLPTFRGWLLLMLLIGAG